MTDQSYTFQDIERTDRQSFGRSLRRERMAANPAVSQGELARRMEIDLRQVQRLEVGAAVVTITTVVAAARALNIGLASLLDWVDPIRMDERTRELILRGIRQDEEERLLLHHITLLGRDDVDQLLEALSHLPPEEVLQFVMYARIRGEQLRSGRRPSEFLAATTFPPEISTEEALSIVARHRQARLEEERLTKGDKGSDSAG